MEKKSRIRIIYYKIWLGLFTSILCLSLNAHAVGDSCIGFYYSRKNQIDLSIRLQSEAREYFESRFDKQVSQVYETEWNRFLFYYTSFFREIYEINGIELYSMKKLGFIVSEDRAVEAPSLRVFLSKYDELLKEFKIPEQNTIRPAVVLKNYKTGEYLTVRVGVDPWPTNYMEWVFQNGVRFKSRDMAQAISKGHFPLFLDGLHDVFHLLSFALYPKYVSYLKQGNKLLARNMKSGLRARAAFNLELLSLADPGKQNELSQILSVKNPGLSATIKNFEFAINKLSTEELINRTNFWIKNLQNYLIHYSAGMRDPQERSVLKKYTENPPEFLDNSKTLPKEVVASALPFFDGRLDKLLKLVLSNEMFLISSSKQMLELRKLLTQLEYALWASSSKINLDQWMKDTMTTEIDRSSPTFQFLSDVFGESSIIYQHLVQD